MADPDDGVLRTALSDVDGERGRLTIRGFDIEELAGRISFEDICGLLWNGSLPDAAGRDAIQAALGRARAEVVIPEWTAPDAMDYLRGTVSRIPLTSDVALTAAMGVLSANWVRRTRPDPKLPHVADYLRMITGADPDPARVAALNAYFVTVADHGMNASTYTARVIASTHSDPVSAVTGALGALKGPLHGGAPGPVLDMFDAIKSPDRAAAWIDAELNAGRKIMGMGHRVYKVRDPRAAVLERAVENLERAGIAAEKLALARGIEKAAIEVFRRRKPDGRINANVEFYTAVVLDAIGVPRTLFTATFAAARVAGWCAHIAEQRATGKLIRPESRYTGPSKS